MMRPLVCSRQNAKMKLSSSKSEQWDASKLQKKWCSRMVDSHYRFPVLILAATSTDSASLEPALTGLQHKTA